VLDKRSSDWRHWHQDLQVLLLLFVYDEPPGGHRGRRGDRVPSVVAVGEHREVVSAEVMFCAVEVSEVSVVALLGQQSTDALVPLGL
jgi:hypothetical protein